MYEMLYGYCPYDAKNLASLIGMALIKLDVLETKSLNFDPSVYVSENTK